MFTQFHDKQIYRGNFELFIGRLLYKFCAAKEEQHI
jgi:hypothetical protein